MSDTNGTWCPVSEAAKILGVSPKTVIRRIRRGELQGRKERNRWVIKLSDIGGQMSGQVSNTNRTNVGQLQTELKMLREQIEMMRERIRDLEADKAYLQQRIVALEELVKSLTPKALPKPPLRERIRGIFRRRR
ncbi:MAG: hypothetical protein DRN90_00640 [Thermoproteota archaeon]|nr:MAG: hypothetical protein DRG83_01280 [Deltaproteobacteria bacterium]RLG49892.1 MAG: hypothetical protein DRN90_00640 [Candidatus Korarchaeota archaeon]